MKRLALLFGLTFALLPRLGWGDDAVVLGVLEHPPPAQQQRLEGAYGKIGGGFVRVAFRKTESGWQAFDARVETLEQLQSAGSRFPGRLEWTVAFDGRAVGHVTSAMPARWKYYSDVGLQLILPGETIPRLGKPDARFQPWEAEKPVYRPLVVLTRPNVGDPDGWKAAPLADADLGRALAAFRAEIAGEAKDLRFADRDVRVAGAYRARSGRMIAALRIDPKRNRADGPPGPEWSDHWFVFDGAAAPRFLERGLALIDAGDYDGDGHSELIFAKSGYNYDGYVLYDDELGRAVEFGWSYH